MRRVRQENAVPDEKRPALEFGFLHEVINGLHGLAPDCQADVAVPPAAFRVAVGHPVGKPAAAIIAFPPLAGLERKILPLGEHAGQCRMRLDARHDRLIESVILGIGTGPPRVSAVGEARVVAGDFVLVRIKAGDDRRQRRPANRRRRVAARERERLAGQAIEVGRLDVRMAHETVVGPSLVIRDDQQDIRRGLLRGGRTRPRPPRQTTGCHQ